MSDNRTILERELAQTECKNESMDDLVAVLGKMEISTIVSVEVQAGESKYLPGKSIYKVVLIDDQGAIFNFGVGVQGDVGYLEKLVGDIVWIETPLRVP